MGSVGFYFGGFGVAAGDGLEVDLPALVAAEGLVELLERAVRAELASRRAPIRAALEVDVVRAADPVDRRRLPGPDVRHHLRFARRLSVADDRDRDVLRRTVGDLEPPGTRGAA